MSKVRRLAVLSVAGLGSGCIVFFGAFTAFAFFNPIRVVCFPDASQPQASLLPYFVFSISISTLIAMLGIAVVVVYLRKRLR
jgi:hypothetical protein